MTRMRPALVRCPGDEEELRRAEIPNSFRADSSRDREEDCQWGGFPERKGWNRQGPCAKVPR